MGVLDQITQMRNEGLPDEDIVQKLQEQGISPKAINDALNQAEIKKAVVGDEEDEFGNPPSPESAGVMYSQKTQELPKQGMYNPQPQEEYAAQGGYQQEYYPQEGYNSGYSQGGFDTSTIIEVSEQVFSEKIQKVQKKLDELNESKTISEAKINSMETRLKRIETMIDRLQIAILEKIGDYGKNIEGIKKEMSMMQDSFGKIINKVADTTSHAHHAQHPSHQHKTHSSKKKSKK